MTDCFYGDDGRRWTLLINISKQCFGTVLTIYIYIYIKLATTQLVIDIGIICKEVILFLLRNKPRNRRAFIPFSVSLYASETKAFIAFSISLHASETEGHLLPSQYLCMQCLLSVSACK